MAWLLEAAALPSPLSQSLLFGMGGLLVAFFGSSYMFTPAIACLLAYCSDVTALMANCQVPSTASQLEAFRTSRVETERN